jgi:hypothetical protein
MNMEAKQRPRGIRNNNPGNIRDSSTRYVGEVKPGEDTDPLFKQFINIAYGYRAMFMVLSTYYKKHGLKTVRAWISRWAPPTENHTVAYINEVCKRSCLDPDQEIDLNDEKSFTAIVAAMSAVENGIEPDANEVKVGYKLLNP